MKYIVIVIFIVLLFSIFKGEDKSKEYLCYKQKAELKQFDIDISCK